VFVLDYKCARFQLQMFINLVTEIFESFHVSQEIQKPARKRETDIDILHLCDLDR